MTIQQVSPHPKKRKRNPNNQQKNLQRKVQHLEEKRHPLSSLPPLQHLKITPAFHQEKVKLKELHEQGNHPLQRKLQNKMKRRLYPLQVHLERVDIGS